MTNAVVQITNSTSPINGLDVVNAVNKFYSSAFNHTVWLLGILIGLFGVVVPVAYYFLQNRQLELKEKALEKSLSEYLKQEVAKLGEALRKENNNSLKIEHNATQQRFSQLEKNINADIAGAKGGIFHVQGNTALQAGHYVEALKSFTRAVEHFLEGDLLENVQMTLHIMIDKILPKLSKNDFATPKIISESQCCLKTARNAESHNLLNGDIDRLEKVLAEAQARQE